VSAGHSTASVALPPRRILVTGLGGTVGGALGAELRARGHEVVGWDRAAVPIDRYDAMERFVAELDPHAIVSLAIASRPTGRAGESWLVNHDWPSELAWICRLRAIRFLHTSTAMVFSGAARGPFTVESAPDAEHGYGFEKRCSEARVWHQLPSATIVRLGWQIALAPDPGSNQMLDYFDRQVRERGRVPASSRWVPACSFLPDTAAALARALDAPPGLYHLDGNPGHTMLEIARALSAYHGDRWPIEEAAEPVQDQRLLDPRLGVSPLAARLPALAG
jgi:dTDP-4-dehydrorhamnose reductase